MRRVQIRKVADLGTGHTPSRSVPEYWVSEECTIPWLTLADVKQVRDGKTVITGTNEKISTAGVANSSAVVHPAGTVAFSRTASVGFSCILGTDMATSQDWVTWTCGPNLDPRYLLWVLRGEREQILGRTQGSTHKTIYMPDIEELTVPLPPTEEQRRIAKFLDVEIERIDQLVATKARTVDVLDERRWTSFVEQLGELQADPVPVRRVLKGIVDGPFGSAFSSSEYVASGVAVVRLGNIGFARWRGAELAFIPEGRYAEFERHGVHPGDVLVAGLGDANNHAGRACVAPELGPAIVKGKCFCARVDPDRADPRFLALFLSSPAGAEAVAVEARGSTRQMINLEIIKNVPIPLPSHRTQVEIIERTESEWALLEEAKIAIAREMELLRERRRSVIVAAVSGEMEVA